MPIHCVSEDKNLKASNLQIEVNKSNKKSYQKYSGKGSILLDETDAKTQGLNKTTTLRKQSVNPSNKMNGTIKRSPYRKAHRLPMADPEKM